MKYIFLSLCLLSLAGCGNSGSSEEGGGNSKAITVRVAMRNVHMTSVNLWHMEIDASASTSTEGKIVSYTFYGGGVDNYTKEPAMRQIYHQTNTTWEQPYWRRYQIVNSPNTYYFKAKVKVTDEHGNWAVSDDWVTATKP